MPITHGFQSGVAAAANRSLVDGPRWNAPHVITLASVGASTSGNVAAGTEVEEAIGGSGGIVRNLPSAVANPGMVIRLIKVDSGVGAVTYQDIAAALIAGQPTYMLSNQWQYVVLQASTISGAWNIIGNN